jgi:hypothetical protein
MSDDLDLTLRVAALEERMDHMEKGLSGRRGLPILVSLDGICGVDPKRDSTICPDASLYRRQKGCMGDACKAKSAKYYSGYRSGTATKVAVRKRRGKGNL